METVQSRFKRVIWGFHPSQVHKEIQNMQNSHQESTTQYQLILDQLQAELDDLNAQADNLNRQLQDIYQREHIVAEILLSGQATAIQIIKTARTEADSLIDGVQREIKEKQSLLQEMDHQQNLFMDDFRRLFNKFQDNCSLLLNSGFKNDNIQEKSTYQPFLPQNLPYSINGRSTH